MSRTFFTTVSDALWGFLPPALQGFQQRAAGHNLKVWYGSLHEHYEVQRIGRAVLKQAGATGATGLEVGFHAEHPGVADNDGTLARIAAKEKTWRRALGREPVATAFLGPKHMAERWRRVSEVWVDIDLKEDGAAIEAAERLATYIRSFEPILARPPDSRCACWKA